MSDINHTKTEDISKNSQHHYKQKRYHIEYSDDATEMFYDWIDALKRMLGGDIYKSINLNQRKI